ncbi:MAG: PIN domain-containing protein, partial [Candidatus Acidiferrales bacterium]
YDDYTDVEIQEVVRRGIKRIRPASDEGEELRDVVLWLVALKYAKQARQRVAFISDDKGFRVPNGTLHSHLQEDLDSTGVDVAFYRSIRDFVAANALECMVVEQDFLEALVSPEKLKSVVTEQLLGSRLSLGAIRGAEITRSELVDAKRYRVAEDSDYVEAHYIGESLVRLVQTTWTNVLLSRSPDPLDSYVDPLDTAAQVHQNLFGVAPVTLRTLLGADPSHITVGSRETAYKCNFDLRLSLRIVHGVRESLEVDGFHARDFTPAATSSS